MPVNKTQKPPKKITETYLQNSGLFYLQRFPASRAHFQSVMMRKINKSIKHHKTPSLEEAQQYLDKITNYFEELGFLNDRLYALGLCGSLFRKGIATKVIRYKLQQKGVSPDIISEVLAETLPNDAERIAALRLLKRRRYGMFAGVEDKKDPQKVLGLLARSGFSYQISQDVMDLSIEDAEEYLATI